MMETCRNQSPNLLDLPLEDVLYKTLFPFLSLTDCLNLRKISLDCQEIIDNFLPELKCVQPSDALHLSPADLMFIATRTRKLKKLSLENVNVSSECVEKFVTNNRMLTHLNLSYTCLEERALGGLIHCTRLRHLSLMGCHWVTDGCLQTLSFHLPKLASVNVAHCSQIDPGTLSTLIPAASMQQAHFYPFIPLQLPISPMDYHR